MIMMNDDDDDDEGMFHNAQRRQRDTSASRLHGLGCRNIVHTIRVDRCVESLGAKFRNPKFRGLHQ